MGNRRRTSNVDAVTPTATDDHLGLSNGRAELPYGGAEWREHRIERVRNNFQLGVVGKFWEWCEGHFPSVARRAGHRLRITRSTAPERRLCDADQANVA
jgi:hypothetical protein